MNRQTVPLSIIDLVEGNPFYALKEKFYGTLPTIIDLLRAEVRRCIDIDDSTNAYECLAYLSGRSAALTLRNGRKESMSLPPSEPRPFIGPEAYEVLSHWIPPPYTRTKKYFSDINYMLPWIETFNDIYIPITDQHELQFNPHASRAVLEFGTPCYEHTDAMMIIRKRVAPHPANIEHERMSMTYERGGCKPDIVLSCLTMLAFCEIHRTTRQAMHFAENTRHVFLLTFGKRDYYAPMTKTQRARAKEVFSQAPLNICAEHAFCFRGRYLAEKLFT